MIGKNIDLRQLRHVVVLGDLLNFTKASEALAISQSALSRSIQNVEAIAGVLLFDRDRGGVRLTPVGTAFVSRAARLLRQADELTGFVESSTATQESNLTFGMTPLVAQSLLGPALLDQFVNAPNLHVRAVVRQFQSLLPLFIADELDFFVALEGSVDTIVPLRSTILGVIAGSALVRSGHPILKGDVAGELADYPVIMSGYFGVPTRLPPFYQSLLKTYPRVVGESYNELEFVTERTDAIWLTMGFAAHRAIQEGRLRELRPQAQEPRWIMRLAAYSHPRRAISGNAERLQQAFKDELERMWRMSPWNSEEPPERAAGAIS